MKYIALCLLATFVCAAQGTLIRTWEEIYTDNLNKIEQGAEESYKSISELAKTRKSLFAKSLDDKVQALKRKYSKAIESAEHDPDTACLLEREADLPVLTKEYDDCVDNIVDKSKTVLNLDDFTRAIENIAETIKECKQLQFWKCLEILQKKFEVVKAYWKSEDDLKSLKKLEKAVGRKISTNCELGSIATKKENTIKEWETCYAQEANDTPTANDA